MRMMETTLLTGPYDWDPKLVPRAQFDTRITTARAVLRERGLHGLIVGGTSPEHGALAWLTGFTPKLGPALAFIPAQGDLRIAFSGGPAMLPSAQRLTCVEKVQALRDAEKDAAAWLRESGGTKFALWGEYAITNDVRRALDRAAQSPLVVLDETLDPLRRRKSDVELGLLRRAGNILANIVREFRSSIASGKGVRSAALASERAAYAQGAQDVRMLASMRNGGMPQPLEAARDPRADPLLACIAVRFAGYWAEGLVTVASKPHAAMSAAEAALAAVLSRMRPGIAASTLVDAANNALSPCKPHSLVHASLGNGLGLSRVEAPFLRVKESAPLHDGEVVTLRVGAHVSEEDNAIASAMVVVEPNGIETIWK
jgi:Xaa-Pro aminopeptidase